MQPPADAVEFILSHELNGVRWKACVNGPPNTTRFWTRTVASCWVTGPPIQEAQKARYEEELVSLPENAGGVPATAFLEGDDREEVHAFEARLYRPREEYR